MFAPSIGLLGSIRRNCYIIFSTIIDIRPTTMKLSPAIPILRSFSEAKAKEFYLDFLGFTVEWEHRFDPDAPLYMEIRRAGLTLHVSEHHGDATPGATLIVPVDDIDALHMM